MEDKEMSAEDAKIYRGLVARANYLAQDRTDISFAVKELCRNMASPKEHNWRAHKRLARYLVDTRRMVVDFEYQNKPNKIRVWVDTDHAGCKAARKSTSRGIIMIGCHMIKEWSMTQGVIALSSGEAEYYGIVKGSSVGMGVQSVIRDMGVHYKLQVLTDSSAAKGIASRRGLGRVRHIEVNQLWVQEKVADGSVDLTKISGEDNISDSMTKHVGRDILEKHLVATNLNIREGRHKIMPSIL